MRRTAALALSIGLVALVGSAQAQYPFSPYPYPYYNGGGGASTVGQSYAMGMADLVRAAGDNHLRNSEAAKNYEEAESQDLDNRLKGTQTYFEMRKINTSARKAEQLPGLTTEDSWRYAQMYTPKRLNSVQLDPVNGKINWPMMLQDPLYSSYRKQLEQLFVQRETSHGGVGYETYTQIQQAANALLDELKKHINDFASPNDYIQSKSFIESLAYEAKFPAV